jgi:hypothetical protein
MQETLKALSIRLFDYEPEDDQLTLHGLAKLGLYVPLRLFSCSAHQSLLNQIVLASSVLTHWAFSIVGQFASSEKQLALQYD